MAAIIVEIAGIEGESTVMGYEDQLDAVGIRDSLETPAPASGGRAKGSRTVGQARHSDVELLRLKDIASPKLAEACSSGRKLDSVVIRMFRTLETGPVLYMSYELTDVFVSRIEHATLDDQGGALEPHIFDSSSTEIAPAASQGAVSLVLTDLKSQGGSRTSIRPVAWKATSSYTNLEVERVLLNPAQVSWIYNRYIQGQPGGNLQKGWDIQRGAEKSV